MSHSILGTLLSPLSPSAALRQRQLADAAHEFEAQMMKELLKPMAIGGGIESGEDAGELGFTDGLKEFASEALGRALSEHGGFGISAEILHRLSPVGPRPPLGMLTGKLQ